MPADTCYILLACKPAVGLLLATLVTDVFGCRYAPCTALYSQTALQPAFAADPKHDMVGVSHTDKGGVCDTCMTCRCKQGSIAVALRKLRRELCPSEEVSAPLILLWTTANLGQSNKQWENRESTVDCLYLLCLALFTFILSKISATSVMSWSGPAPGCPARAVWRL